MKARHLPIAVLAVIGSAIWAWNAYLTDPPRPVTDAEARGFFGQIAAAARARDFEALCQLNGTVSNCQSDIQRYCPVSRSEFSDPAAINRRCRHIVPREPPVVVSTRHVPPDEESIGGRIVVVSGIDGQGGPHETEVIVFRADGGLRAISAVYWSGTKFPKRSGGERDLTRVKPVMPADASTRD